MKELIIKVLEFFKMYNGQSIMWILLVLGMVYIFYAHKRLRKAIVYPVFCIDLIITNPLLYQKVWVKLIGDTYWRMFWILPVVFIICLCATDLAKKISSRFSTGGDWIKIGVVLVFAVIIGIQGKYMYFNANFTAAANQYKLPQDVVDVADRLLELSDHPRIVAEPELYNELRQYDTDITLLYGRNAEGYIGDIGYTDKKIAEAMKADVPNYYMIAKYMYDNDGNYLVVDADKVRSYAEMEESGLKFLYDVGDYKIYENIWNETDFGSEWFVSNNISASDSFITITDIYGEMAILEGGGYNNENTLRDTIKGYNAIVKTWIIDSFDVNYSQGFYGIYKYPYGIAITSKIFPDIFNDKNAAAAQESGYNLYSNFEEAKSDSNSVLVSDQDEQDVLGLKTTFYGGYEDGMESYSSNTVKDSAMIIKFSGKDQSVLYIPNISDAQFNELYKKYGDEFDCDYLIINRDMAYNNANIISKINAGEVHIVKSENNEFSFKMK